MFARGFVGGDGVAVEPGDVYSPQAMERVRDALMVKLQGRGVPTRAIAVVVGLNQSNVVRRINSIPPSIREWYERMEGIVA